MHKGRQSDELDQLLLVARSYLRNAKQLAKRHSSSSRKTLREVNEKHKIGKLSAEERLLAHLSSAAVRLSTISEILNGEKNPERYNRKFYESRKRRPQVSKQDDMIEKITQELDEHIHDLLRDDVGHMENEKDVALDRREILLRLPTGRILSELESCASRMEERVREKRYTTAAGSE